MRRSSLTALLVVAFFHGLISQAYAFIDSMLQMQLGNPSSAIADTNNHEHYLIQRTVEALDYNDNRGQPNWASWDLTAGDIGTNSRSSFITDTNLPANFYRVTPNDYLNSGYDRGHLCPSKDRTDTSTNNDLVFLMSNIMPQNSQNNSGVWLQLENYCRDLVQSSNNYELLVICGPSGYTTGATVNTNGRIFIPDYVWKIIVVVPPGTGMATNRITATNRVIAVKIPNNDSATNNWQSYVTSANQIQVDTGLNFFTALAPNIVTALRAKVDGQTNPPPDIYTFAPASGAPGVAITITGTNFGGATQVAFNGTPATFTVDSAIQITTSVPTDAGSGSLSVTTASGTAISSNNFTVLNNGGSVYSGVLAGWDMSGLTGGSGNYGPSPFAPTTNAPNVNVVGLTRAAGVKTTGTAAAGGWGGVGFTNTSATSAAVSNLYVYFSLTVSNGYKMSFAGLSRFDYYRSGTGPTNGLLQYQVGTGAFTDIQSYTYSSVSGGSTNPPLDLTGFTNLQNIAANTTVTFRIANYNGGASGTWYVFDKLGTSALDLALVGTVTQIISNSPVQLNQVTFTNNQFSFTVTGTVGASYVVQTTTNLASTNWTSVITNTAPFVFTRTNPGTTGQIFYRARLW